MLTLRLLALLPLALAAACGAPAQPAPPPPVAPAPATAAWIEYSVAVGPGAEELAVEIALPPGPERALRVDDGAHPFLRDVSFAGAGGGPRPIVEVDERWTVPPCPAGCRVRYRFLLAEAADAIDEVSNAAERRGAFLAPPSTWLLWPSSGVGDPDAVRFRLRVATPPGIRFVSGLFRSPGDAGSYEAALSDLPRAPYAAFGPMDVLEVPAGEGTLEVALLPGALDIGVDPIRRWVDDAARSIKGYYGRFPVPTALVIVVPTSGRGPGFATALGNGGASVMARLGRSTTEADLVDTWELTHELVHVAFPNLHRRHSWLEEGMATYVEPIARARLGLISADKVWRQFAWGMPKGLPEPDDRGLDATPTWGRLYWGGALFCFVADLEIRQRTGNQRSLDDALRGVLLAGGDISARWPIEQVIAEGDRATGVPVLSEMYERWKDAPVDVDIDALWRKLGLRFGEGRVFHDPAAPLAGIREAITAPAPQRQPLPR